MTNNFAQQRKESNKLRNLATTGRARLIKRIKEDLKKNNLQNLKQNLSKKIESPLKRESNRQRLIARIKNYQQINQKQIPTFFSKLKWITAVFSMIMFLFLIHAIEFTPHVTQAHSITFVTPERGDTYLKHPWEDNYQIINETTIVHQGDTLLTGISSEATVYFFDNSLVRLMPQTEILINKLEKHPYLEQTGVIDFKLIQGQIWTKALQIQNNLSKFIVETKNSIISTNNATFIVKSSKKDKTTNIETVNRSIKVTILNSEKKKVIGKTTIQEGYQTKISPNQNTVLKSKNIVHISESNKSWHQKNLQKDAEHLKKLNQEIENDINNDTHKTLVALISPEIIEKEKPTDTLSLINKTNLSYQEILIFIKNGENKKAQKLISNYKKDIQQLIKTSDNNQLNLALYNNIADKEQFLISIQPESPYYKLKETIEILKEAIPQTPTEHKKLIIANTKESLNRASDLFHQKHEKLAIEELQKFNNKLTKISKKKSNHNSPFIYDISAEEEIFLTESFPRLNQISNKASNPELKRIASLSTLKTKYLLEKHNKPLKKTLPTINSIKPNPPIKQVVIKKTISIDEQESIRKEAASKRIMEIKKNNRKEKFLSKKSDEIIQSISIYKNTDSQKNALLRQIRELKNDQRFAPYQDKILSNIVNNVPIKLRHKVKAELQN